ncbi:glycine betaine/L-proline ABC transporter substrate-binding protein ProX [Moorena bouillonii]|uniref:glycine betaine/L-proline ABC transporter substrate-binding protein ProX n=1 Tax=Moorena bouillonii TaxID=207920 RepID=UPI000A5688E6|nr:glycine betaine/L-proline ABC transporter substrate-binding protein ProX [Moorena bouillonii]
MFNSLILSLNNIATSQVGLDIILNPFELYTLPLDEWITAVVNFLVDNFRPFFQAISLPITWTLEGIQSLFLSIPPLIFLIILGLIVWQIAGGKIAIYSLIALTLIGFFGAWEQAMTTLALVVTAVVFCVVIGISLGIACASSDRVEKFLRPLLDAMQTLPSFVYLVPVVMLFGIGAVPGVIATLVFAVPPLIRLTNLGIRQVSTEVVEAAIAFGSTPRQMLWEVQIPLAMPTILAGVNQAILLALSMSVVTSMIGVGGLGQMVLQGLGRVNVGLAAVGGLSIVLIAVMLDRITQVVSQGNNQIPWLERGPIGFVRLRLTSKPRTGTTVAVTVLVALLVGLISWQQVPQATTELTSSEIALPGKGVNVRSTYGYLADSQFMTHIVNTALEKLGYEIEKPKQLQPTTSHIALGNNDLDFTANHWEKLHTEFFEKNGGDKKLERVGVIVSDLLQGYQIDKKTAEKYNITNLEQLKDPKIAKLFDFDGNGKANLAGCIPGWGCELVIEHHLDAYGLRDTVEHDQGEYSVLIANTIARYKQGKPVLYYTWTPLWLATVLKPGEDVVWLEVAQTNLPGPQKGLTEKHTSIDGKNLGFAVDQIRFVANKKFIAANPAARKLFELFKMPIEDINAESLRAKNGEDTPADIYRHSQEWIKNNQDLFDSWVEEARNVGETSGI